MEGKGNISDYRSKLDKTLASPELTNYETIHTLVKNQILQSLDSEFEEYREYVVEKRSKEMFNFLSMLRSACVSDFDRSNLSEELQSGWKVKEDTDEYRVMYREGPEGTPLHTLLVEGYVDGPLDVCLCVSCESDLYSRWWPQTAIPTFKVVSSQCVQKVRIGEQISLVRMKVSWPLASREALVHFFTLEYFKDGLIVVLLNSISDLETIDKSTHGFTRDGIPDAEDVVRIDVVGGLALQKVTADRSYFRTIANMDIKLDFVPPAFINFMSRQLVGSGFKLYKKEIASVSKGDVKFREALKDPMYIRVREALYSQKTCLASPPLDSTSVMLEGQNPEAHENINIANENENSEYGDHVTDSGSKNAFRDPKRINGITEFANIAGEIIEEVKTDEAEIIIGPDVKEQFVPEIKDKVGNISRDVQPALGIMEKAISMLWGYNSNSRKDQYDVKNGQLKILDEENGGKEIVSYKAHQARINNGICVESSKIGSFEASHESKNDSDNRGSRHKGSNSDIRETNGSKIALGSPDEGHTAGSHSSVKQITVSTVFDNMAENYLLNSDANSTKRNGMTKRNNKKPRFCCFAAQQELQG